MLPQVAAVVGTGFIGPIHVEALRRQGITVRGILGSSIEKSEASAKALGLAKAFRDLDEILSDDEVTVVHLASPNRLHKSQALAALGAGKHVVCEKPLGITSRETAELVEAEKRYQNLVCAVNYNVRFYPLSLEARALVRKGELGEIFHLHGSYTQDWLLFQTDFNWRVLASEGGQLRAVGDIGTHWIDLITFVSGMEVEAVMADLRTIHPVRLRPTKGSAETFGGIRDVASEPVEVTTEDYGSILLRFKGGAKGAITVSQVNAGRKNSLRYEIAGSKCAVAWDSESPDELWIGRRTASNTLRLRDPALLDPTAAQFASYPAGHAEGFGDSFKQLYSAVYTDIRAGRRSPEPLYATFADGHRSVLICEAIAESHRRGLWITVAS
jgi:predicted dehydrogenase